MLSDERSILCLFQSTGKEGFEWTSPLLEIINNEYMLENCSSELSLAFRLLFLMGDQVTVAQSSLILAAANRPIYPTMHCLRHILSGVDFRLVNTYNKTIM